jgi:hypothetical protein
VTSFAPGNFSPLGSPKHTLPSMDVCGSRVGGGKSRKTRDRAEQSSSMDGTHECTTGSIAGQHFFCGPGRNVRHDFCTMSDL